MIYRLLLAVCCISVPSCAYLPRRASKTTPVLEAQSALNNQIASDIALVDINSAGAMELARLPGIGHGISERIVEHRTRHGRFRRKEHLLLVAGIGERRYRGLEPFITVGKVNGE